MFIKVTEVDPHKPEGVVIAVNLDHVVSIHPAAAQGDLLCEMPHLDKAQTALLMIGDTPRLIFTHEPYPCITALLSEASMLPVPQMTKL